MALPRGLNSQVVAKPTNNNTRREAQASLTAATSFSSNADNINTGTIDPSELPLATATTPGIVQPDDTTIAVNGTGIINAIEATSSTPGIVEPDNVTTFVVGGVISATGSGGGSVVSVGLALPGEFTVSGSPVTTAGTLTGAWANETANTVFSGPSSGSPGTPSFRTLTAADLPADLDVVTVTAGSNLSGHTVVNIDSSGLAENPSLSTLSDGLGVIGITTGAISTSAQGPVLISGEIFEPSWSWTPGSVVWADNAGGLTQTPPSGKWLLQIGVATASNRLVVNPTQVISTP